tara:strand:+ start:3581 stop:3700 length:120 start_codon:yes stop_codon:yes gene_type:complete
MINPHVPYSIGSKLRVRIIVRIIPVIIPITPKTKVINPE